MWHNNQPPHNQKVSAFSNEHPPRPLEQAQGSEHGENESPATVIVRQRLAEEAAPLLALLFVP